MIKISDIEISEGCALIAEFMEDTFKKDYRIVNFLVKPSPFETTNSFEIDELLYHKSWDWLMPVLFKIASLGKGYKFGIFPDYNSVAVEKGGKMYKDFHFAASEITDPERPVLAMFKVVVKFIKWFNEQDIKIFNSKNNA